VNMIPLGQLCEIVSGATPKTSIAGYWDGDIDWATPADLSRLRGAYIDETPRKITAAGLATCAASLLPVGSVLLSSRAPIGHVAINTCLMATNQGFKSLVPNPDLLDAKYLYYWVRAHKDYLQSLGNGATFKEISKATLSRVEVPVPHLDKQRCVAAILDQADALCAKRRRALAHLDDLTQSIFHDMFSDPIANPFRHPIEPLASWIARDRPITYGILKPGPHIADGVPYVRVADMQDRGISVPGVRRTTESIAAEYRRSRLRSGDLLMSIRGHVGRFAFVPDDLEGANITQDSARLAVRDPDAAVYVRAAMESPGLQHWMAGRTKGAAVQGINLGDLRTLPLPFPPEKQVERFATLARRVERQRDVMRSKFKPLDELFASLRGRAFQGEL